MFAALLCTFFSFTSEPQICVEQCSADFTSTGHRGKLPATPTYLYRHAQGPRKPFGQSLAWFDLVTLSVATCMTPTVAVFSKVISHSIDLLLLLVLFLYANLWLYYFNCLFKLPGQFMRDQSSSFKHTATLCPP